MARAASLLLAASCAALSARRAFAQVQGNTCNATSPTQTWTYLAAAGTLASGDGACLSAAVWPAVDGTQLIMLPCGSVQPAAQAFDLVASNNTIVLRSDPRKCVNLADFGTAPGTQVWLYGCDPAPQYQCQGNCDWEPTPPRAFRNSASGLCLDDGGPPMPPTCTAGSPAAGLPFCNPALSFEARAADLVARLSPDAKRALWVLPLPVSAPALVNRSLGLAAFLWDITAIHGLSTDIAIVPQPASTGFVHAIGQAATWDVALVGRALSAVALEARIVRQRNFRLSGGTSVQALNAEGGPLANTVHDPRWGRIQETYGEDPWLVGRMGVAAVTALQNRSAAGFLQMSSVTRHYLGYHGANDLPPDGGAEWVSPQYLEDHHLPAYEAQLVEANAEGLMCSCNTLRVGPGDGTAGGIPACVHPLLWATLRGRWRAAAFVQGDNEAIFPMVDSFHYYATLEQAVAGALNAGVAAVDSGGNVAIVAALGAAVADGNVTAAALDAAIARQFAMRMRVGEFDMGNPAFPFAGPYDEAALNGPEHRALAREAVAASVVLLQNAGGLLPLSPTAPPRHIAVIGPWGDCHDSAGGYGCVGCYQGNYASPVSATVSIADGIKAAVNGTGANVSVQLGTLPYDWAGPAALADAVAAAAVADLTVLVVGTGCAIETEGVDRVNLTLPFVQEALLYAVAQAVRSPAHLLVLVVSAGLVDIDPALAAGLAQVFLTGEQTGAGVADVLFGAVSPSARLPLTGYRQEYLQLAGPVADFNLVSNALGTGRTYRYQDRVPPGLVRWWFGHGLSYAAWRYSGLTVARTADGGASVAVTVHNDATVGAAHEVVQCYVTVPAVPGLVTPRWGLQGFARVAVPAGGAAPVVLTLRPAQLTTVLADGSRATTPGGYTFYVGGHQPDDPNGQSNVLQAVLVV